MIYQQLNKQFLISPPYQAKQYQAKQFQYFLINIVFKMSENSFEECLFCAPIHISPSLPVMMTEALFSKYSSNANVNQSSNLTNYIDVMLKIQESNNAEEQMAYLEYKQFMIKDEEQEYMKREYAATEFQGKIQMLTEYYKFHRDVPRVIEKQIQKILGKYHDKKREYDYKKIKKILKQEQGISITSVVQSEDSSQTESRTARSRYSTLLNELQEENQMSDSKLLKDMCKQIDKGLTVLNKNKNQKELQIKGAFFEGEKLFEEFIRKQEERERNKLKMKQKQREKDKERRTHKQTLKDILEKRTKRKQIIPQKIQSTDLTQTKIHKKQKDSKFIYNTNIKIQIRNAMFYSQGRNSSNQFSTIDPILDLNHTSNKNSLISKINFINSHQPSKKLLANIYKSTQGDYKKRKNIISNSRERLNVKSRERLPTKERLTTKQSRQRSLSRQKKLYQQAKPIQYDKRNLVGSSSARKLNYNQNDLELIGKAPTKSISTMSLKKRPATLSNSKIRVSTSTKKLIGVYENPPLPLSRYGSSEIKGMSSQIKAVNFQKSESKGRDKKKSISIQQLLSRKLNHNNQY